MSRRHGSRMPAALRDPLTEGEWAVAKLAARGFSNSAIAKARAAKPRTIANQLSSIYQKLAISGRRELARRLELRGADAQPPSDALGADEAAPTSEVYGRHATRHWLLSAREQQVLASVALGRSNKQIAAELGLSLSAVGTYLRRARKKLRKDESLLEASSFRR